jgi:hypothetical protein
MVVFRGGDRHGRLESWVGGSHRQNRTGIWVGRRDLEERILATEIFLKK